MVGVLTEQLYLTVLDAHCLEAPGAAAESYDERGGHSHLFNKCEAQYQRQHVAKN